MTLKTLLKKKKGFFAFRIDSKTRIIFDFDEDKNARFYNVGNHDIYY